MYQGEIGIVDPQLLQEEKMDMRADQMESLSDAENDAMDQLLKDTEEERQVQKRVFSSFNMSHGRSEHN